MRSRVVHLKRYLPNAGQQRVSGNACEWPGWPELRGPGRGVPQDKIWPWGRSVSVVQRRTSPACRQSGGVIAAEA